MFTACTAVQAVVKANSQSNGNGQISTPRGSQTPEQISMKLGIYNYVGGYDHTCKSTWRCDNVGGLGEHVPCHMFRFLSIPFYGRLWNRADHYIYSAKLRRVLETLWRVSTMFTRPAITPPEVYGFGRNLGYSEYIVWSRFWVRSAQKQERKSE